MIKENRHGTRFIGPIALLNIISFEMRNVFNKNCINLLLQNLNDFETIKNKVCFNYVLKIIKYAIFYTNYMFDNSNNA